MQGTTARSAWPKAVCSMAVIGDGLGLTRPGEPSSARRLLETSEAPPDGRERRDLLPVAPSIVPSLTAGGRGHHHLLCIGSLCPLLRGPEFGGSKIGSYGAASAYGLVGQPALEDSAPSRGRMPLASCFVPTMQRATPGTRTLPSFSNALTFAMACARTRSRASSSTC